MGVWAATAVVTGEAISLGIFLTPAGMAKSLGSPALLGAVWCGMAVMALTVATLFRFVAPVRRWWFPLAPAVFLIGGGLLAAMLLSHSLWPSLLGAAVVLAGLPMRWLLVRKRAAASALAQETAVS
jgi:hypothetical protein